MRVFIFDFDLTLTIEHTEPVDYYNKIPKTPERRVEFLSKNMKSGVAEMFRNIWSKEYIVAIATFNSNPFLVLEHLQAIGLTQEELASIIIEERPYNYPAMLYQEQQTGQKVISKNGQIKEILKKTQAEPANLTFIEDTFQNIEMLKQEFPEAEVIHVLVNDRDHSSDFIADINTSLIEIPQTTSCCRLC